MNTLFQKVSSKPALSLMILVGFLGLMFINLIWPGSVATAAQNVAYFVNGLWIGEHTLISFTNPDQIIEMEDGSLVMQGEYAGEIGAASTSPNLENSTFVEFEIRKFDNLAEAQTILPFRLVQPSYLPEAFVFTHVKIFGDGDLASAHLHYYGPGGDLLLSQRPVGGQADQTVSIGLPEDYIVESVEVNDQPATWAKHVLMWEADGISYLLSSPTLSLVEAVQIAESIH